MLTVQGVCVSLWVSSLVRMLAGGGVEVLFCFVQGSHSLCHLKVPNNLAPGRKTPLVSSAQHGVLKILDVVRSWALAKI